MADPIAPLASPFAVETLRPALFPLAETSRAAPASRLKLPLKPPKSSRQQPVAGASPLPPIVPAPIVPAASAPGVKPAVKRGPPLPDPVLPPRRKLVPEVDPWAPLGVRAGALLLRPSVLVDTGYDSNPNQSPGAHRGSSVIASAAALDVASDWSRHSLTATLRGAYLAFPDDHSADRPLGDGRADLRLDALRDTALTFGGAYALSTERPGSIEQPVVGTSRSLVTTVGGSMGLEQTFGRFVLALKGETGRTDFENVPLAGGGSLSQADRNYATHGVAARAAYELTPAIRPFLEGRFDERRYDERIDAGGYERSSRGWSGKLGATLALTSLVTGEIAAGFGARDYQDPRLAPLRGPIVDAQLIWTATALTTVKLKAGTELAETAVANASGALVTSVGVEIDHALRRNLIFSTGVVFTRTEYSGAPIREDGWAFGARLEYKLTRSLALRASAAQQRLISTVDGNDYTANIFLVGLKLQR